MRKSTEWGKTFILVSMIVTMTLRFVHYAQLFGTLFIYTHLIEGTPFYLKQISL